MAQEVLLFFVGFGAQCGSECSRQRIEEDVGAGQCRGRLAPRKKGNYAPMQWCYVN